MSTRVWTEEKLAALRSMALMHTMAQAAVAFSLSFQSVSTACRRYGVRFKKPVKDPVVAAAALRAYRAAWMRNKRRKMAAEKPTMWIPEVIEFIRMSADNLSFQKIADRLGATKSQVVYQARKHNISFERQRLTNEEINAARRAKYRARNPLTERNECVEAVARMAPTMTFTQIAAALEISRGAVGGICARYGIKTVKAATFVRQTAVERAAKKVEKKAYARTKQKPKPRVARTFTKPGRLVARMLWSGHV